TLNNIGTCIPSPSLSNSRTDLVLRENSYTWLKYVRTTTPTLPSRSADWCQRTNLLWHCTSALLRLLM
ncbi:hypothetical protein EDB84DRAFT_1493149, partial [Lactarius hengduanensis]